MYRLIRWCGDPSPWEDPEIAVGLAKGRVPRPLAEWFEFFNKWQRQVVINGRMTATLGVTRGFRQTYQFGPEQYLVWMTDEDAALLFRNRLLRWQFVDVTDCPRMTERPPMTLEKWLMLREDFSPLGPGRREGSRLSDKQIAKEAQQRKDRQFAAERAERFAGPLYEGRKRAA